jgi:putative phage-type endonuclease
MKKILDKRNMDETAWQEYRRTQNGLGGSDCAVIMGLSKWKTPFTLWLEKTRQIEPPEVNNQYVEWGNLLEPVIREKFKKETGFKVFQNNFVLQHDEYPFMIANIDGEVIDENGERGLLEVKTTSERNKGEWEDGPPNHYHLQIQHYLAVLGYSFAYVACLIGGNQFVYFRIERDDYVIDKIITAEKEFWHMVQHHIPPEITGLASDSNYLAESYPNAIDQEGYLRADLEVLTKRYTDVQKEIKLLQEESDYIKNRIKLEAKELKILKGESFKINMPTIKKISFDSKTFANDYPELFEKYKTKETSYRSFIVSEIRRE